MSDVEELIKGTIDMHLHSGPDTMPCIDPLEAARQAKKAGMKAIVLKNHHYGTAPLATITGQLVSGIGVFGGVCLDFEVGGINPHALEVAGELGARVVWMPTMSSANSRDKMRKALNLNLDGEGFSILLSDGRLVPEIDKVLDMVKKYDMVLASGHISPEEVFALFNAAQKKDIKKLLITHASSVDVIDRALNIEEQKRLAGMGVFLEYVAVELLHESQGKCKALMTEMIKAVGADHCIISTDMGLSFEPPPVEGMRNAIASLLKKGFTQDELERMMKVNPAVLLGIN